MLYLFDSLFPDMPTHLYCSGTFDSCVSHEDDFGSPGTSCVTLLEYSNSKLTPIPILVLALIEGGNKITDPRPPPPPRSYLVF